MVSLILDEADFGQHVAELGILHIERDNHLPGAWDIVAKFIPGILRLVSGEEHDVRPNPQNAPRESLKFDFDTAVKRGAGKTKVTRGFLANSLGLTVGKFPHLFLLRQRQHPLPPVPVEVAPFYAVRTIESKKVQRGRTFGRLRIEVAAIRRKVLR
jgi:hypothetical protein